MLFDQVSKDIIAAMKAHDKVALETLRNIKKVFLEAKTAPGANDTLEDADALKLIQKLVKQGKDAAEIYTQQGRADLAEAELAQVKVMETYLPKPLSDEELTEAIKQIIAEAGATSMKDMGKVMGIASNASRILRRLIPLIARFILKNKCKPCFYYWFTLPLS